MAEEFCSLALSLFWVNQPRIVRELSADWRLKFSRYGSGVIGGQSPLNYVDTLVVIKEESG